MLWEIVAVERELGNIRGVAHCWQDYVPIMRLFPSYKKNAIEFRKRRDDYILHFYEELQQRIAAGTDNPCIAGNVIKDPDAKLTESEFLRIDTTAESEILTGQQMNSKRYPLQWSQLDLTRYRVTSIWLVSCIRSQAALALLCGTSIYILTLRPATGVLIIATRPRSARTSL